MMHNNKNKLFIKAMMSNSQNDLLQYLNNNKTVTSNDIKDLFYEAKIQNTTILSSMFTLLKINNALSKDIDISTLKYIFYVHGICLIEKADEIEMVNLKGVPGLPSIIRTALTSRNIALLKSCIDHKIQERPLFSLFLDGGEKLFLSGYESKFTELNIIEIELYKQQIIKYFSVESIKEYGDTEKQCLMAELLITHPNNELFDEIKQHLHSKDAGYKYQLLPFFCWAAKNNKASLFANSPFLIMLHLYPDAAEVSILVAAAFGSVEFIKETVNLLNPSLIKQILSVAAVTYNMNLLKETIKFLERKKLLFKDILDYKVCGPDPLLWAINSQNNEAIHYMLQNKITNNEKYISGSRYLFVAVFQGDLNLVRLLFEHGEKINIVNKLKQTLLHKAIINEKWDVALALIKEYHLDMFAKDCLNKTCIDYIKDTKKKNEYLELANNMLITQKQDCAKKINNFIDLNKNSTDSSKKVVNISEEALDNIWPQQRNITGVIFDYLNRKDLVQTGLSCRFFYKNAREVVKRKIRQHMRDLDFFNVENCINDVSIATLLRIERNLTQLQQPASRYLTKEEYEKIGYRDKIDGHSLININYPWIGLCIQDNRPNFVIQCAVENNDGTVDICKILFNIDEYGYLNIACLSEEMEKQMKIVMIVKEKVSEDFIICSHQGYNMIPLNFLDLQRNIFHIIFYLSGVNNVSIAEVIKKMPCLRKNENAEIQKAFLEVYEYNFGQTKKRGQIL